jgi:hypothetical protein
VKVPGRPHNQGMASAHFPDDAHSPDDVVRLDPGDSHSWQPLAGAALLERLRITGRPRPKPDPEFAATFRQNLEDGLRSDAPEDGKTRGRPAVARPAGDGGHEWAGAPLVVTKDRLTRVLTCEAHHVAAEFGERPPTIAMACGAMIDVLFRQLVTVGSIGDPVADGMSALAVDDRQQDLVSWIGHLPEGERAGLFAEVQRQVTGLIGRWPTLDPGWMPRTQETLRVDLADGAVQLSARVDLAVGRPADDLASVAIVEVKSGARRIEHRADLHFYALVECLRSPAPPFVVATYYTRTGELDVEPVSTDLLVAAGRRTLAGIRLLRDLAAGAEPRRTPSGLCGWCAALPDCDVGQRHVGRTHLRSAQKGGVR